MNSSHRTAGLAGLCFTLATVVGFSLQPSLDFDASAPTFAAALADGEGALLASGVAMALAAVALQVFLSALGAALDTDQKTTAGRVLSSAGAAAGALLALGFLSVGALAAWTPDGGADAAAVQTVARMANTATNVALLPLAAAGLAVALLSRSGVVAAWLGGLGVVAAGLSVFAAGRAADEAGFLALLLWLIWAAALSVTQLRRARARTRSVAPASA